MAYLESLRRSTRTEEFTAAQPSNLRGLLPPSISHEGYSDKPAYSYWDDFWAVRGYKDAVDLARAMGQLQVAEEWAQWRDERARASRPRGIRLAIDWSRTVTSGDGDESLSMAMR